MSNYVGQIESLLLVAGKPLSFTVLAKLLACSTDEIQEEARELQKRFNEGDSGIHVMVNDGKVQFITNPDHKKLIAEFIKDETTGELTKPSIETLTIIAYRQPVTKQELEQIRGINCSLILRNLLIRGLIEAHEARGGLAVTYSVTMDFLRFLGVNAVSELPEFERLHNHENLKQALAAASEQPAV
ncbi:MAG: hypothetical protein A3B30_01320 [Candidatus Komeilibacteria bacterium RIFCSPLOWO2_01_FULL_52_15]|uniref:SMC-Scp complex subunit ScpB n=1 Tax=Candidatus Komeilibacteria bacterium RIFCSPLOWO2_01_FULL_52_15 TaxID=1798551 RepID=A0A1G2BRA7_9BACT|nr:MAG: hypothetical protein A3B30_01320 [Candidatus Komeilibacteria bacterium RIFCSPLOWO2_01_FULL_52_15]